jgi:hypothetical protein
MSPAPHAKPAPPPRKTRSTALFAIAYISRKSLMTTAACGISLTPAAGLGARSVFARGPATWKATALAALAPHVPAGQWSRLLGTVIGIEVRDARSRALAAIAPHVPRSLVPRLVRSALELRRAEHAATVLRGAGARLGERDLAAVLAKAKRVRRHGDRGILLAAIAAHLSEAQADEALTFVRRIKSTTDRALAIDALAQRLSGPSLEEAIASLDIDDDNEARATLAALASWLPEAFGSDERGDVPTQNSEAWRDGPGGISGLLTSDVPGQTPAASAGPEQSLSVDERDESESAHGRADVLARLTMAAPIIAEARAATAPRDLDRPIDPDPLLYWIHAAEVLIPDSRAVQTVLHLFGQSWWEDHVGDFGAEAIGELIDLLVELEQFDDAVAAASAFSHPLSRAVALARLAPALPSQARSEAISQALSSTQAALESHNIYLRQGFGFPGVELVGVTGLALQQHLLTPGQREKLAELIRSNPPPGLPRRAPRCSRTSARQGGPYGRGAQCPRRGLRSSAGRGRARRSRSGAGRDRDFCARLR